MKYNALGKYQLLKIFYTFLNLCILENQNIRLKILCITLVAKSTQKDWRQNKVVHTSITNNLTNISINLSLDRKY